MTHNISLDAKALSALADSSIKYMALLGPTHRKHQVIAQASLNTSLTNFPIASPAGLSIGGELPESIALSILSECHAYLNKKSAESMSDVLARAVEKRPIQQTG
jgi:xanthine dehydrogenase accessory factor